MPLIEHLGSPPCDLSFFIRLPQACLNGKRRILREGKSVEGFLRPSLKSGMPPLPPYFFGLSWLQSQPSFKRWRNRLPIMIKCHIAKGMDIETIK